jgi:hypothetical protein
MSTRRISFVALTAIAALLGSSPAGAGTATTPQATSGTSPFAGCTADQVASQDGTVYPNSEVEPSLAVSTRDRNGDGALDRVGAYQQDRWDNGAARGNVVSVWYRGSWVQRTLPGTSGFTGGSHLRATVPWVTITQNGTVLVQSLATSGGNDSAIYVNRSTDGGLTWGPAITIIDEDNPFNFNDKNSITADPTPGRNGFVYQIWDRSRFPSDRRSPSSIGSFALRSDAYFTRSTDNGATWGAPHAILAPQENRFGIGHQIAVLPNGTLIDVFLYFWGSGSNKKGQEIAVMRSTDAGLTWSQPITVTKVEPGYIADPTTGEPVRTGDIIPDIGVAPNGTAYLVWQDSRFGTAGSAIALSSSSNGGLSWSAPRVVNGNTAGGAFTASVEVNDAGVVGVGYYDFRADTPDPATLLTDYWFTDVATGVETRVTRTSFDMKRAPFARGYFLGDYEGLTSTGNVFQALFAQTTASDPANVYYAEIRP